MRRLGFLEKVKEIRCISHNPLVVGSNPTGPTNQINALRKQGIFHVAIVSNLCLKSPDSVQYRSMRLQMFRRQIR